MAKQTKAQRLAMERDIYSGRISVRDGGKTYKRLQDIASGKISVRDGGETYNNLKKAKDEMKKAGAGKAPKKPKKPTGSGAASGAKKPTKPIKPKAPAKKK